jgi:hypothetical protein
MDRFEIPFGNVFIKLTRLWLRVNAKFFAQKLLTSLVLLQRGAVLARLDIDLHQLSVRRFIEGI